MNKGLDTKRDGVQDGVRVAAETAVREQHASDVQRVPADVNRGDKDTNRVAGQITREEKVNVGKDNTGKDNTVGTDIAEVVPVLVM